MRFSFILLFLFLSILLPGNTHKFYVSITQIDVAEGSQKLEISSRIFTHDLEETILAETGIKLLLGSENEYPKADSVIYDFFNTCLTFKQDKKDLKINYIGKEIEADVTWVYLESNEGIYLKRQLEIKNLILFEKFPDQKNIVNLRFGKSSESQIHTKSHPVYQYELERN